MNEQSNRKKIICIACPVGCRLDVEHFEAGCGQITVIGNKCKRGVAYASEELTAPKRTVTAVMQTDSEVLPYVPVRTDKPLAMEHIKDLLHEIYSMKASVPIKLGQAIITNFKDTNVNVFFTRSVIE